MIMDPLEMFDHEIRLDRHFMKGVAQKVLENPNMPDEIKEGIRSIRGDIDSLAVDIIDNMKLQQS